MTYEITCAQCAKKTDASKYCTTQCSECKLDFCCALTQSCFVDHHRITKCRGSARTITNPQWIVNLKQKTNND